MDKSELEGQLNLRVGATIFPSQDQAIERVLVDLKEHCPAQFILVADVSGQLVSTQGERGPADLVALSALIAGDLAASQEIARLTGQYQSHQLVLREGQMSSTFLVEAGRFLVLFVRVSSEVPLGWARLMILEAGRQIGEIMAAPPDLVEEMHLDLGEKNLSDAVGDLLDSMWAG